MILLAQVGGYTLVQLVVIAIVIAAIIAIALVVMRQMGVTVPPFILTILWIVIAAVVGIFAIKLLLSMV